MQYFIDYTDIAIKDAKRLAKNEPAAFKKLASLIEELKKHPYTGTGHPHQLSGDRAGQWSRSITKKHRLVYEVIDNQVCVLVLSTYGHYDDK